jgi:glutamate N-acetyltransferase / amino-acid N-acetyltransferase
LAARQLRPQAWSDAAEAIMTTDTFAKASVRRVTLGAAEVTVAGIAKGSGMIAPDMATMLAFVFTDAKVPAALLQAMLTRAADRSFNCITVDGDTSTSDTLLAFATGQTRHAPIETARDAHAKAFARALEEVCTDLAQQIVRDGEGAQKFVTVDVTGAASTRAAKTIALSIANSPLVKTAIAGEDANWGRIVMAVGKAGEKAERDKLKIAIGGVAITEDGQARKDYNEAPVAAHMKTRDIRIAVDVGIGRGKARVWTCDLTHGYIDINGAYRS